MKIILSPSKSLDFETKSVLKKETKLLFSKETEKLVSYMREYSILEIKEMMSISDKLAELNANRYKNWTSASQKQSIAAFAGDVYDAFKNKALSSTDIIYLEKHLRIISGLYGVVTPFTMIKPYRLEMSRKIFITPDKTESIKLYDFWRNKITDYFAKEDTIVNLASNEYSKSIDSSLLKGKFITIVFKTFKNGVLKIIPIFAKKERGNMALWMTQNNIKDVEQIKNYKENGYHFSKRNSSETTWVFVNK